MTIGWVMVIFAILGLLFPDANSIAARSRGGPLCFLLWPLRYLTRAKRFLERRSLQGQGAGCYGIFVLVSEYPLDTDDAFMKAVLILLGLAALLLGWGATLD
jgi:hypothetical protein